MDQRVLVTVLLHHDQAKTQKAWGAFRYQVFPAYDFAPIAAQLKKDHA